MIPFVNDIDRLLQAAESRYGEAYERALRLTASAQAFEVALDATVTPAAMVFIVSRVGIGAGLVEFVTDTGVPLTVDGDVAILNAADMTGLACTVTAIQTWEGQQYVDRRQVLKLLAFDATPPAAPRGLYTTPALASIRLDWDATNDTNIDKVEIWRALENKRENAVPVGSTAGLARSYVDNIGAGGAFYYWLRYVSKANVVGPFNALAGVLGQAGQDAQHLLELLSNSITETQLQESLRSRIDLIDAEGTGLLDRVNDLVGTYGDTAAAAESAFRASSKADEAGEYAQAAIESATLANTSAAAALTYRDSAANSATNAQGYAEASARDYTAINARLNNAGGTGVTVEQKLEASASDITGLRAQYTVKIDNNGYVTGYGLASSYVNGVPKSAFSVLADSFRIGIPGVGAVRLFYVDAGGAYMDKAFIRSLEVSKITSGDMNAEWRMTGANARIVLNTGSVMKVIGTGFGANRDLIEWFGPSMPIEQCSKQNATTYAATDGSAYFGGALRAGALYNARRTTVIDQYASLPLGPFWSNGNPRSLVVSYSFNYDLQNRNMNLGGYTYNGGDIYADIQLLRGDVVIASSRLYGNHHEYNESDGPDSAGISIGGSFTFTDTGPAGNYTYTARIVARVMGSHVHSTGSSTSVNTMQSLGIVSTEV